MAEAAAVATPPPAPAAQASPPQSAGVTIAPQGQAGPPEWANSFNEDLKSFVAQKNFKSPQDVVESYQKLEKYRGVPAERLIQLPEKMEGDAARVVWERLGAPRDAKGYELPTPDGGDEKFADWASNTFHKFGVPKSMAEGLAKEWNERSSALQLEQRNQTQNAIKQADEALKLEWGGAYDQNIHLAKQGVMALGLDAKMLDVLEAVQGREKLFKTLSKIGAGVGEAGFVTGKGGADDKAMSQEEAMNKIESLKQDRKFMKSWNKNDAEARRQWEDLHKAAFPGERPV